MSGLAVSALAGMILGLSLAAPPGPMNAVIAEESVRRGFRAGFSAGAGAMSADGCFFLVAWAGVATVVGNEPRLRGAILAIGGLLMLVFAVDAIRDAGEFTPAVDEAGAKPGTGSGTPCGAVGIAEAGDKRGFLKAFSLSLTNPFQLLWWLTVGVTLLDPGTLSLSLGPIGATVVTGSPAILVGFFAGIALWIAAFPASLIALGRRIDGFAPLVAIGSAAVLAGFGLLFLYRAVTMLVL